MLRLLMPTALDPLTRLEPTVSDSAASLRAGWPLTNGFVWIVLPLLLVLVISRPMTVRLLERLAAPLKTLLAIRPLTPPALVGPSPWTPPKLMPTVLL